MNPRRAAAAFTSCLALALAALVLLAALGVRVPATRAQTPEADVLAIERQLRCPQCTNERLDVCELRICEDIRTQIRQRLAAGEAPDSIVASFRALYGDRILWALPRRGFNLALLGWVGASLLAVLLGGGFALRRMRRTAHPATAVLTPDDEAWLDHEIERARDADGPPPQQEP